MAIKYEVQGYPTIIFMDHTGRAVETIFGYAKPDEFSAVLEQIAESTGDMALFDELVERLEKNESDVDAATRLGILYAKQGNLLKAIKMTNLIRKHDANRGKELLAPVYIGIADQLTGLRKYAKARSYFKKALKDL